MGYATSTQFTNQWGDLATQWSNQDDPAAAIPNTSRIQEQLDRASDTIDGYLRVVYGGVMPFNPQPADLDWRCLVIAAYYLARYPDETLTKKYEEVMRWLRDVAAGRSQLAFDVGGGVITETSLPQYETSQPIFDETTLEGW